MLLRRTHSGSEKVIKLDRLLNALGAYGARLRSSPLSRDVELRSVVVHDPIDQRGATGDLFLAVGIQSVDDAVLLAARARALAVLVRADGPVAERAVSEARDRDMALVTVDLAVPWSQLSALTYGLILESRETEAGRGPTDLFALADALADALGRAVLIDDEASWVLAYSSQRQPPDPIWTDTILHRRVPEDTRRVLAGLGVFAHLRASDRPLFVAPDPDHGISGRMVVAIRAGHRFLGAIWVRASRSLTGHRHRVLEDGARTAALHLLRSRASADLERQVESDLVIRLLEGTGDASAMVSQLGLPHAAFRVLAVQARRPDEGHTAALLVFSAATAGFGWSRPGRSTLFGTSVYTVLPSGDEDVTAARRWVDNLAANLPEHIVIAAGIGAPADATELPVSRHEADESLALATTSVPARPAVAYDESWHELLLRRLRAAVRAGRTPRRGPVADLTRHDAEHGTRYVETLRAWLMSGDAVDAARSLEVHPNTVRYRLRKMGDVTSLRLDHADSRLAMLIALAAGSGEPGGR